MKHKLFKIKNTPIEFQQKAFRTPNRTITQQNLNSQFSQMIGLLTTFIKKSSDIKTNNHHNQEFQLQPRDRLPLIDPLKYVSLNDASEKQLKLWMTNVCKTVFSATFNFYLTDQLNYEQARSFCSESILHNLIRLAQKVNLNSDNIKMLDNHMQYKILPYMAKKYPLTGQSQINKALEDFIQEVNSFQQLQNDFIYISGVKFHYRQSGNYNDLIMKVINYHLIQIDKQSEYIFEDGKLSQNGQSLSNYKDFEEFMINLFQKVQNQNWMINQAIEDANNSKKPITSSVQNQKYREKIRSFTNYRIGRKISQNVELFQEHEILNGHLIIKNHSILRILTKWCEQLQQKFKNPNYMKEHYENIQTLGGDINSINDFHRQIIDDKMSTQFGLISEYLQKLKQNFYEQQHSQIMNNLQDNSCDYIEHYDHVFGTFSIQIVRNLHMYIIKYLNRLIHGMISVAYDWHRESGYKHNYEKWSYPPTLVTFRIGDLIRCKCSSKQKQILAIFKQLTRISSHFPDKLKIIRIKNRLRSQTNDILINVKYNKHLIGQIQLAVNTKKQKFAQLSNNLNHYCYQLSRCIFGPFSQLASIWKIHDQRSKQFQSFLRTKGRKTIDLDRILKKQSQSECQAHNFERYELPFRCSYCNKYHTHNDLILSNVKCKSCGLYKCIRCRMRSMNQQELKQIGFGSRYQQLKAITQTRQIQMCTYGIYVTIDSKRPQLTFFKQFKINGIIYYLAKVNGNIFKIVQSDKKSIQQFFYHNIVFKLLSQHQKYINLTANEVKQKYILPKYIHKIYKSQKEVLFLNQKNIDNTKWAKILNKQKFKQQIQKITKIQMRNNNLPNIDFLAQIYPHLQSLNLGHNINCNITKISSFKQLKYINLQQNNLTQIPKQIYTLSNLQQLDIYKNNVNQLGTDIYKLTNLKTLNLKYNNIIKFSPQFSKLTNLKQILLKGTVNLKLIPDQITLLSSLEILNVAKCNLSQINPNIRKLTNLRILQLSVNLLKQLPQCIGELVKLQKLKFQENNIQILPKFISNLTGLTQLFASKNKIRQIDIDYSKLTNLIIVYLDFNQLQTLDENLFQIEQLRELYLQGNKFNKNLNYSKLQNLTEFSLDVLQLFHQEGNAMVKKTLVPIEICSLTNLLQLKLKVTSGYINFPPQIKQLNQLEQLNLDGNNLKTLPFQITYLSSLEKISFTHNMIQQFPVDFLKYLNKLQEIKGSFNKLKKIQKQLIDKIKKIDFSNNEIQQVEILPMNRNNVLKRLILNDNKIKQIPRNLNKLKKLKDLDLRNNQIKFLDENLMKIKSIQHLSFRIVGNPIQKIDCGNFIEDQLCQQSKNFINSLIFNLLEPKGNYS